MSKKRQQVANNLPPSLETDVNHAVYVSPADAASVVPEVEPIVAAGDPHPVVSEEARMDAAAELFTVQIVTLSVPVGMYPESGYASNRCDVRLNTQNQRRALRKVVAGLAASNAQLQDGKFVQTPADAVKWMLEKLQ